VTKALRGKKLLVVGYYGCGNLGDEAIRQALARALATRSDLRPRWLVARPGGEDEIARMSALEVFRAVRRSAALVFGGGGLLQNRTSNRSLFYYLALLFVARCFRRPAFLLGQGIGPIEGRCVRWLTRRVLRTVAVVDCRDRVSVAVLRSLGVEGTLGGDLCFLDPPRKPSGLGADGPARIVFCLRGTACPAMIDRLVRLLDALGDARPALDLDLLPFFPAQDLPLARELATYTRSRCRILEEETVEGALSAIADAGLVISSRLHPLVFALRVGTPFLGVPADPKIPAFLGEVGDHGGPETPCESFPDVETVLGALDAPPDLEGLRAACRAMHERTRASFAAFLDALDRGNGGRNG
jgi:polysaccharide pyruvyl transferase CsaB